MATLKALIDRSIFGDLRCERIAQSACGVLDFNHVADAVLNHLLSQSLQSQRLYSAGPDYKS
jgi:hypothetical protein